jgi:hypothetical protein
MHQESREALIDLLFLSLYLDNHLSLAEDEELDVALESLGWDSPSPREKHIYRAFSAARAVASDPLRADEFLRGRSDTILRLGDESSALTWLSRLLASDGLSATEERFLKKIEQRLFPAGTDEN